MAKKFNINNFLKLPLEEQAVYIEKQTKELVRKLPELKRRLKMYNDNSDEMYNLSKEEVELQGTTYARAVRGGEITTPTSQQAYKSFIKNLTRYTNSKGYRISVGIMQKRLDSWIKHVEENGSQEEIAYAHKLLDSMSVQEKIEFTKSKYFLDTENWNSEGFIKETEMGDYSIQVLKLELFLEEYRAENGGDMDTTDAIYEMFVKR